MRKIITGILLVLLALLNGVADALLTWFLPRWRRSGNELAAQLSHTLHHFKPEIPSERYRAMRGDIRRLRRALLLWRREEVQRLTAELQEEYLKDPLSYSPGWVESIESIVVVLVVLLGLRAYYIQPFRIPTNSMWPSLNGIVVHAVDEIPSFPRRVWDKITLGSSYVDVKADREKRLVRWRDERYALLFTRTILEFDDGSQVELPASTVQCCSTCVTAGKSPRIRTDPSSAFLLLPEKPSCVLALMRGTWCWQIASATNFVCQSAARHLYSIREASILPVLSCAIRLPQLTTSSVYALCPEIL